MTEPSYALDVALEALRKIRDEPSPFTKECDRDTWFYAYARRYAKDALDHIDKYTKPRG